MMMLVDTSVWIDHLRTAQPAVITLLETNTAATRVHHVGIFSSDTALTRAQTQLGIPRISTWLKSSN